MAACWHDATAARTRSPQPFGLSWGAVRWQGDGMILACHAPVYSDDADAARAFFRDVLGFPSWTPATVTNWLIFQTGPSELGVHPTAGEGYSSPRHETAYAL